MKKYIRYIILGMLVVISLPILVNFLAKITLFERFVVGEETTWISFFSGYLGSILGGIFTLLGVTLTINHQNNSIKNSLKASKDKNAVIIESFFDSAFAELLFFILYDNQDIKLEIDDYKKIKHNIKILIKKNKEIQNFNLYSIDEDFILDFVRLRELLDILTYSLEKSYNETSTPERFQKELININLKKRCSTMIEHFLKLTSNEENKKRYQDFATELKQSPQQNKQTKHTKNPQYCLSLKPLCYIKLLKHHFIEYFNFINQKSDK